ncbi:hypothetical protein [Oerskovia flava]|uniref:hypothetical protein n=1 Tax=Oerskovia flava TaxID=2986422 RepID=UPI00223FCA51|nr:hypothetical protein [Oerskovia sp. JB1-3-2]
MDAQSTSVNVEAEIATRGGGTYEQAGSDGGPATTRYLRATPALCLLANLEGFVTRIALDCSEGEQLAYTGIECDADEFRLGGLIRETRSVNDDGTTTDWDDSELVGDEECISPEDLLDEAAREFATLPITPAPVTVQPPGGRTLVNVETITYAEPTVQTFDTALLGIPVTLRAQPGEYTWDYGDGTGPLTTTDPGAPYPDHSVTHTYDQPADAVTITLTTTWTGQFQITGAPTWTDVPGTATTTTVADPLTILEARSRLVTDPLP